MSVTAGRLIGVSQKSLRHEDQGGSGRVSSRSDDVDDGDRAGRSGCGDGSRFAMVDDRLERQVLWRW